MRRSRVATWVALALVLVVTAAGQQRMRNYQLVVLKPGPAHRSGDTAERQQVIKDHVAFMYQLGADRHSMAAGPFPDSKAEIGGIIIMAVESPEQAREANVPGYASLRASAVATATAAGRRTSSPMR